MKRLFVIVAISLFTFFVISTLVPDLTYARPGGGHSYSSGSSSSSSSSESVFGDSSESDSSAYMEVSELTFNIIIYGLLVGLPLLFLFLFILDKVMTKRRRKLKSIATYNAIIEKSRKIENLLIQLKIDDSNFSKTLFLDFVSSVFTKYYSWQNKEEFKNISPYFTHNEINDIKNIKIKKDITEIVIGSVIIANLILNKENQIIIVEFNANYTATQADKRTRYEVTERWQFSRKTGLLSQEPEHMRELSCPACGQSSGYTETANCESCGTFIENGKVQWFVKSHNILRIYTFKTNGLASYAPEAGTGNETIYQADLKNITAKFAQSHHINWEEWQTKFKSKVVTEYFNNTYAAWSVNKLDSIRNLLSDNLYESFMFWIDNYKKEGLTNKLDNILIRKIDFAKIDIDKFYESITVRVHASCKDYVTSNQGNVLGGSKTKIRKFSEYWTFIRRSGVEKDVYDYGTCPNCNAANDKMGQSGTCEYCNTKISNGDFSWVLAVVTQDEVYKG